MNINCPLLTNTVLRNTRLYASGDLYLVEHSEFEVNEVDVLSIFASNVW